MLLDALSVPVTDFECGTGWTLRPEGACCGDVCIPLPIDAVGDGIVDVAVVAGRMGMPLVHDAAHRIWALGPWPGRGRTLTASEAPELTLPDLDGTPFSLSSLRGHKVLLLAWAPY